jgi:quercetin dioxygenase-like cupin family protein
MRGEFSIVRPKEVPTEQFNTCETSVRKLTWPLGSTELRVNQVIVEPGEVTTPHTHTASDDETHLWLAFGAPPVGTVDDFGAYEVSE